MQLPAPSTKPDRRFSRIRLSCQHFAPYWRLVSSLAWAASRLKNPMVSKYILPPVMVPASRSSSSLLSFAQDSAQSVPHPSVHFSQQALMGALEVSIPAPCRTGLIFARCFGGFPV